MLRWQREDGGRMSRREMVAGRRTRTPTPTPHRVSAMPNAAAGIRGDTDSEEEAILGGMTRLPQQRQNGAATGRLDTQMIETTNQHRQISCLDVEADHTQSTGP